MGASDRSLRNERLSRAASTLLALLRHPDESGAAGGMQPLLPQAWDEMLDLARRHGVTPLLHRALQARGLILEAPDSIRACLEDDRRATALDNLRNYGEFRRIAQALRDGRIPVIALKGLHLAELVYRDISLRPMGDLDILVPQSQLQQASDTLAATGYSVDKRVPNGHDIGMTHDRIGVRVEVHWALSEPTEFYALPAEDIWRLSVPAKLFDAEVQVMSPEFLLLHVCAHLAYHHSFAFDLRALCDIAEIVRTHSALDWPAIVDECQYHHAPRGVAVALRLARDHMAAAVPRDALNAVGGAALDAEWLADAFDQLITFPTIPNEFRFAPNIVGLASSAGPGARISTIWKRIFVPRAELARIYGVPEQSARLTLYYAIRLRDLVRRYAPSAWSLHSSKLKLAAIAARHARLEKWIAGG